MWEVSDADGTAVGLYLGDFFAREGKRGGAWMSSFVRQSDLLDTRPVVVNNLNVTRGAAGQPTLLTLDEVNTLFHEFGHALHGLSSAVTYPRFSGTSVPRDFVEFPSQVNEMWALWPQVLGNYARHVETGEPLPASAVEAIDAAQLWGEGFGTLEYLAATLLDQAWHRITPDTEVGDPIAFEQQALEDAGVASELVPPRYRTTYFQHIFAGGYAAGYYSYIWSEVLDADTVEWFKENGGLRRENGDAFRQKLLAVGGSIDPLAAFRAVRGRDADPGPLLRRRGLAPAATGLAVTAATGCCRVLFALRGRPAEPREAASNTPGAGAQHRTRAHSQGSCSTRSRSSGLSPSRTRRLGWRWPQTVQRCTTCQPLPDFSTRPIGSIGAWQSLARSPGSSSTCSDHRQCGQWLR